MTVSWDKVRARMMQDPEVRAEYERIGPAMEIAFALADARRKSGLTQGEVATRMGTSQAAVARLEGGKINPSWGVISRFAEAVGARAEMALVSKQRHA
jgi:predicted transcriptional regulator